MLYLLIPILYVCGSLSVIGSSYCTDVIPDYFDPDKKFSELGIILSITLVVLTWPYWRFYKIAKIRKDNKIV